MANPRNAAGVFFSGLNGIRFFAAAGVILHHFEQIKWMYGVRTPDVFNAYSMQIDRLGPLCVSLFFVLSGFLITFLLLEETSRFGKIDVRKFYIRRILRIWPVYFLLTFVSFFLLPGIHLFDVPGYRETWSPGFWPSLGLFLVFCPQLVPLFYFPGVNYAQALWSVGVEEWFYAVWPWLIRFTRGQITLILLAIIIGLAAARFYASGWVLALLTALRFDCMAVGGLFAVLLFRGDQYRVLQSCRSFLFRVDVQIIVYFLFFASFMRLRPFILANETQPLIVSLFFGYAIVNIGANAKTIIRLENRLLHWLGDLSYGLYCYNWIAIVPTVVVVKYLSGGANGVGADVAIFAIGSFGTLALAVLSYEFVERPCLRLKQTMFTLVKTPGPSTLLPSPSGSEAALAA